MIVLKRRCLIICYLLLVMFYYTSSVHISHAGDTGALIMATGSEKGVYYAIGKGISEVVAKANIKINVITTHGSQENLELVSQGKAQLCIVQSDTIYNAYNGIGQFSGKRNTNIQAIASLYTEAVHILVRNPLHIKKIEEFKGKRISIGPEGSGSSSNALAILEAVGITPNEVKLMHMSIEDSIIAIKEEKVDVVFYTAGYPADAVNLMAQNQSINFFEPNPDTLERLIDAYPYFVTTTIPKNVYSHQDEDITTIGVAAVLVGRNDLDNFVVNSLARSIFAHVSDLKGYHSVANEISMDSAFKGITIPFHPGARNYYDEKGMFRKDLFRTIIMNYIVPVLLLLLVTLTIVKRKKIKYFFKKREIERTFVILIIIWLLGSIMLYYAEHRINEYYSNLSRSAWSTLVEWISFGKKEPITAFGRTTTVTMRILGAGAIAWFTGQIASIIVLSKMTGGRRRMDKIKDHFVILNWSESANLIIEQLHSDALVKMRPIIVICESDKTISFPEKPQYEAVHQVQGNMLSEVALRRANVYNAYSVIILAGNENPEVSDSQAILGILAIRKLCKELGPKTVPIIAEISDPLKVDLASFAGLDGAGSVEIVSSRHLGKHLIAQAAVHPGLTRVYNDLLTFSRDDCEIYKNIIPSKFVGKTFKEFVVSMMELKEKNIHVIPIGICRNGKSYVNPKKEHIERIEAGDDFYAICYTEDELQKIYKM